MAWLEVDQLSTFPTTGVTCAPIMPYTAAIHLRETTTMKGCLELSVKTELTGHWDVSVQDLDSGETGQAAPPKAGSTFAWK